MKKAVLLAGLLAAGSLGKAAGVIENFDWGAGVSGRTAVTKGQPLGGQTVQNGEATWDTTQRAGSANTAAVFSGTEGTENGTVTLSGTNAMVKFDYAPFGGWASGVVTATAKGTITWGEIAPRCGLIVGFQASKHDSPFIISQTTDALFVKLSPNGGIVFKAIIGGVTNMGTHEGISVKSGDAVSFRMTVDTANRIATVITTGAKNASTNTVSLNGGTPKWSTFGVQQTGSSLLVLDSVSIDTTYNSPVVLGILGLAPFRNLR